ncbi:dienelactone hydrolase family protein [Modestobacter sp. KNN46-3]|jgi:dienelactone hydrolase|uniref:dienelactone hydrolase family protein n=1 Tax=Modestobacter sp. KNN46-3 TaxID=2711218 RepID=UPI0013DF546F|nr:dienelactone hydrolase family protein [Modestobacter sp. KNN46-3]
MTESSSAVLAGWAPEPFTNAGITHTLHTRGSGPGLVLLPDLPGLTPEVMDLADHLVGAGFTVTVVGLFGDPGRATSPGYAVRSSAGACTSRELRALARRADRPAAEYVRAAARRVRDRVGGPGIGVIGMGVSGGLALASAAEPAVLAPVASQPSTPFPLTPGRRRDLGMSDREREVIRARVTTEGLRLMGLRFSEDTTAPSDRFRALRAVFGDGWLPVSLNNRPGNEAGIGQQEHRVLTSADVETPGHPTHEARAQVVAFLRERLARRPADSVGAGRD